MLKGNGEGVRVFAGWLGARSLPQDKAETLLKAMQPAAQGVQHWLGNGFALASSAGCMHQQDECCVVADGAVSAQQVECWVEGFRQQGWQVLDGTMQPVLRVLMDGPNQRLLLANDAIGQRPLYYATTADSVLFASSAKALLRHPAVADTLSHQALFDYVYHHHCPSPGSIYQAIAKLEGGQCLVYQNGRVSLHRYWMPDFDARFNGTLAEASDALRQTLLASVRQHAQGAETTGAFLSGGLDSSSVTGALAAVYPGQAQTFTIGFPEAAYDETHFAQQAVDHFGTRSALYTVTADDAVQAVPMIATYFDEPFGNSSALAVYFCARLAKSHGISHLLAGDGGDELFAGNTRYARQALFAQYQRVPSPVRQGLEAGLSRLPQRLSAQLPLRKLLRYIHQAELAMPDRLQSYNFLHRHDAATLFSDDFLSTVDTTAPLRQLQEVYHRPDNTETLHRMLYLDWKTTLQDNDLVKVNQMCALQGIEVSYPLLDAAMVALACRIPAQQKLKGQQLRWFYKQAMADFLPKSIINKSKHGFGLPFGLWLQHHHPLQTLAYDAINDLKQRGIFRPDFLNNVLDLHQNHHAAYYGELIWVLMMLELWLAQGSQSFADYNQ